MYWNVVNFENNIITRLDLETTVQTTDLWDATHAEDFAGILVYREEHAGHVRSLRLELLHCSIHRLQPITQWPIN